MEAGDRIGLQVGRLMPVHRLVTATPTIYSLPSLLVLASELSTGLTTWAGSFCIEGKTGGVIRTDMPSIT